MHIQMYTRPMTRRYSIAEARATLPSIVDEVDSERPVEITRRGKPVAVVLSLSEYERLTTRRPTFSEAFARFRHTHALSELGLEGELAPRDPGPGRTVEL
jgi:prevent-host-death family protein